jgi:hypothetical protein
VRALPATACTPHVRDLLERERTADAIHTARVHLGAALLWAGPGDDEGVIENVKAALRALERATNK